MRWINEVCMASERLDKLLSASGRFTRSEARAAVLGGRVSVNGAAALRPEMKILRMDLVIADGEAVDTAEFVYYMLHKPADTVSAVTDERFKTVLDLFPEAVKKRGVFPAGRLDADVTGLLVVTDDGGYAHRLTSPRSGVKKIYEAVTDGALTEADVRAFAQGIVLADGTAYRPAKLQVDGGDCRRGRVTVTEGKYHEVKNLFAVRSRKVLELRRVAIGALALDETLRPGAFRPMSPEEAAKALL